MILSRALNRVSRDPIRRTMRLSLIEGGLTQAFLNWTTGSVLVGYMLHYGATPTQLGLVASVPLLAQASSPFAAWLASYAPRLKILSILLALLGRGLWLLAALLPLFNLPGSMQVPFLVGLVAVSSFFQAALASFWTSWMGDVVPVEKRGRYFGFRAGLVGLVGMSANLGAGWFLDRVTAPFNFQIVMAVAVVLAVAGVALLPFHFEPRLAKPKHGLLETLRIPWQDANFRKFLVFGVYWQAAVLLAAPFVIPYFLDFLKMSFTEIALWSAVAATSGLATTSLWGRLADRYGNKSVLQIGTFLAGSLLPLSWLLATPENRWPVYIGGLFDAMAWGAIGPAMFNLVLASAPKSDRLPYVAMFSLVTGVAGFLGGLLSGPLLGLFGLTTFTVAGFQWTAYHSLFVLSGLLRTQAWRFVRPVAESKAWRTRDVLRQVKVNWRGAGFFWRS